MNGLSDEINLFRRCSVALILEYLEGCSVPWRDIIKMWGAEHPSNMYHDIPHSIKHENVGVHDIPHGTDDIPSQVS